MHELLPRAFPKRSHTLVWIDAEGAASCWSMPRARRRPTRSSPGWSTLLGGGLRLAPLQTAALAGHGDGRVAGDKRGAGGLQHRPRVRAEAARQREVRVRYARHTLDIDEVASTSGKASCPHNWR